MITQTFQSQVKLEKEY